MSTALIWFRNDLRLDDNPALIKACEHDQVVPLYILDESVDEAEQIGGAQQWWLHHSLEALAESLKSKGSGLILRRGDPRDIVLSLIKEHSIDAVYWNRCYDPHAIERDKTIKEAVKEQGIACESSNALLCFEPWTTHNKQGGFYKVFTPFWKHCYQNLPVDTCLAAPSTLPSTPSNVVSDDLQSWQLLPTQPDWSTGFTPLWTPGEKGARQRWDAYKDDAIRDYHDNRNLPAENLGTKQGTSRLSPHLHFGEISPRRIYHEAREEISKGGAHQGIEVYLSEIGWREFSYNLLYHCPTLRTEPFNPKFSAFPWDDNEAAYRAWCTGQTGYPIVDAGMRELYETGYMHNRVRMIVGSFLTKHLLLPWQWGERWFWDTLLDADLASNSASWQWVSGSGADAAPYFRVFNPITQGEKFDSDGEYTRHWVPELRDMPREYLFSPWEAPDSVQKDSGARIGADYPKPVVDHKTARERALKAYEKVKQAS